MPGIVSSFSNGEEIVFAENADFSGAADPSKVNGLQTDMQMWIGSTAVNAGGTHINVGQLISSDGSVTFTYSSPNIDVKAVGGTIDVQTLTPNEDFDGSPATKVGPQAGTIKILGSNPILATVTETFNSTGTAAGDLMVEHRAWLTKLVVDPSSTPGTRGTFATIAAALAAVAPGQTVFVRSGTYTENLILPAGICLTAFSGDAVESNVVIIGKITMTASGTSTISNIRLTTNGDFAVSVTGANALTLNIENCFIDLADNDWLELNNANAQVRIRYCTGDSATVAVTPFIVTDGDLGVFYTVILNGGSSAKASTFAVGTTFRHSIFHYPVTTSGTGNLDARFCRFQTSETNTLWYTHGGSVNSDITNCQLGSGSGPTISVSVGSTVILQQTRIRSTNANPITGAGEIRFANVSFAANSSIDTATQKPLVSTNDSMQVVTPGAYPYTTKGQDALILVDTSAPRTIIPVASPQTGQKHIIKDAVGSGAANHITVTPSGKNIDGAASYTMNANFQAITIVYNGTEWNIV